MNPIKNLLTFRGKILPDSIIWSVYNASFLLFCASLMNFYIKWALPLSLPHGIIVPVLLLFLILLGFSLWKKYLKSSSFLYVYKKWIDKFIFIILSSMSLYVPILVLFIYSKSLNPKDSFVFLVGFAMMFFSLLNFTFIITSFYYFKAFKPTPLKK